MKAMKVTDRRGREQGEAAPEHKGKMKAVGVPEPVRVALVRSSLQTLEEEAPQLLPRESH